MGGSIERQLQMKKYLLQSADYESTSRLDVDVLFHDTAPDSNPSWGLNFHKGQEGTITISYATSVDKYYVIKPLAMRD